SRAINIEEIIPQKFDKADSEYSADVSELFKMIRLGDRERIEETAERYLQHPSFSGQSLQQHHVAVMEMLSELYRFAAHNDIPAEDILGDLKQLYDRLIDLVPEILRQWLTDTSFALSDRLARVRSTSSQSIVSEAR